MAHAIIWCRVSTIKQEFESQKKELIKTALKDGFKEQDLIVIGEAGASAIKMNDLYQKEVDKLIETIDSTKSISCVYVWEVSRLARNKVAFQQMTAKLISNKIQLKCNVPQLKLLDDNGEVNNGMELTFDLLITLAKQEMDIKMKRFARGKKRKADENKYSGGRVPYGYRVDKERDNLIIVDEHEGEIVKLIYDLYEKGLSQPKIAKELNDSGKADIKISLINNILTNESYTGKKIKQNNASYERAYHPIITQEQFDKCRKIAIQNNTNLSKAKNIYFADHLVRCSSCGAFWSATGSKASYHCAAAYKSASLWNYEYHRKARCHNKTSLSINVLDSILWHVAVEKEACYIEQATDDKIQYYIKESDRIKEKINNIEPRLRKEYEKRERLQEMYIDGLSKEAYDKRKRDITDTIASIRSEEIQYKDELKRLNEIITQLNDIQKDNSLYLSDPEEILNNLINAINHSYPVEHQRLIAKIAENANDKEKYDIIHRQVKSVEVLLRTIRYPFKRGEKDVKCKFIRVHTFIPSENEKRVNKTEGTIAYYVVPNGGYGALILDLEPDEIDMETPYLYDYELKAEYPFNEISDYIYLNRYHDIPKRKRRNKESAEKEALIGDKLPIKELMKKYKLSYGKIYDWIHKGKVHGEMINGVYYVSPNEAEEKFGTIVATPTYLDD